MRKEIVLNGGCRFHKGDISEPISKDKGFILTVKTSVLTNKIEIVT